jgi:small subunit ribosomal protein S20
MMAGAAAGSPLLPSRSAVANIKQQKKRILVAQRQRLENLRYRSQIKTYFKRLSESVNASDSTRVDDEHRTLVKLIDKAAARNALHANTAARKKSRAAAIIARGPQEVTTRRRSRSR